jgi:hypothetical protein
MGCIKPTSEDMIENFKQTIVWGWKREWFWVCKTRFALPDDRGRIDLLTILVDRPHDGEICD